MFRAKFCPWHFYLLDSIYTGKFLRASQYLAIMGSAGPGSVCDSSLFSAGYHKTARYKALVDPLDGCHEPWVETSGDSLMSDAKIEWKLCCSSKLLSHVSPTPREGWLRHAPCVVSPPVPTRFHVPLLLKQDVYLSAITAFSGIRYQLLPRDFSSLPHSMWSRVSC